MIYRDFQGEKISALGFGTMRLPVKNGNNAEPDEEQLARMVRYAIDNGVNYFDTAWGYHEGKSETAVGRVLSAYPRNTFYLASKFPGYDISNFGKHEEIFYSQLKKCQVEYFDFYLLHNICEANIEQYMENSTELIDFFVRQKKEGKIRHLGFSAHGTCETIEMFMEKYGKYMEFCQLQINYIDITFQHGAEKLEQMKQYNLPVIIMEPVRGGKLAKLSEKDEQTLRTVRPDDSTASWAFRYVLSLDNVFTVLSGMSDMNQVKDNVMTFLDETYMAEHEKDLLHEIAEKMIEKSGVPCTSCRYCIRYCSRHLDIPNLLELYNEFSFSNGGFLAPMRIGAMKKEERPESCIGCRQCEKVCPQQIVISEIMSKFSEGLKNSEF